jgi:sterol 3beta-glucosyltransferase
MSHRLFLGMLPAPYHRTTNRWRAQVGLPPGPFSAEARNRYGKSVPKLYGYRPIGRDPEHTTSLARMEALRHSGQRAVLVGGWGGLCAVNHSDTVHFLESASYDWLFPRVAAVVHHGGAGSTGEGLRAGKPTVVCPFFGDQPFWGRRVYELGVGPRPIPRKRLTAQGLAAAIQTVLTDQVMRHRASVLGEKIRIENGVQTAVRVIEAAAKRT